MSREPSRTVLNFLIKLFIGIIALSISLIEAICVFLLAVTVIISYMAIEEVATNLYERSVLFLFLQLSLFFIGSISLPDKSKYANKMEKSSTFILFSKFLGFIVKFSLIYCRVLVIALIIYNTYQAYLLLNSRGTLSDFEFITVLCIFVIQAGIIVAYLDRTRQYMDKKELEDRTF